MIAVKQVQHTAMKKIELTNIIVHGKEVLRGYLYTFISSPARLSICTMEIHTFSHDVGIAFAQLALLPKLQNLSFENVCISGYVVNRAFYKVGIQRMCGRG